MLRAGDYERALAVFGEVLSDDPNNRFGLLRAGLAEQGAGRPERAVPFLERAVEADPQQPEARYALADALTRSKRIPSWLSATQHT